MEKLILLALTALSIFLTYEIAQCLGLLATNRQREVEKLIGLDRSTPSAPDSPNSAKHAAIYEFKSLLLLVFLGAIGASGSLVVATFRAFFS
jgi:hypothetical protein